MIVLILLLMMLVPSTALAYIDPSSGSMVLQVTIGLFLSALFVVKLYWRKLLGQVTRLLGSRRNADRR